MREHVMIKQTASTTSTNDPDHWKGLNSEDAMKQLSVDPKTGLALPNHHHDWQKPFPNVKLFTAIVGTQIFAALMCGFGLTVPALPWTIIGLVWVYTLI